MTRLALAPRLLAVLAVSALVGCGNSPSNGKDLGTPDEGVGDAGVPDLLAPPDLATTDDLGPDLGPLPTAGLDVYTSPTTSRVSATAYLYSDAVLAGAPLVRITSPSQKGSQVSATLIGTGGPDYGSTGTGQWWKAPLPGGEVGVWQIAATATTQAGDAVGGRSSYEIAGGPVAGGWHPVGPNSLGGMFTIDPKNAQKMYATPYGTSQVYASSDAGQSWQMARTLPVAGGYPSAILALGGSGSRLVLSVNGSDVVGGYVDLTYLGKAFESTDGGQSWRDLGLPDTHVYTLLAPDDGSFLLAITSGGVELTRDDGAHWSTIALTGIQMATANWFDQAALIGNDLYLATVNGLFAIRNIASANPSAPALLFDPSTVSTNTSKAVLCVAGDAQHLFTAPLLGGDIFVSTDQGATFTKVYTPGSPTEWAFHDIGGTLYADTGAGLAVSSDGGATFQVWPNPPSGAITGGFAISGGTVYASVSGVGIYTTTDKGQSYTRVGLSGIDVNALAVGLGASSAEVLVAGTNWDSYRSPLSSLGPTPTFEWGAAAFESSIIGRDYVMVTSPDRKTFYKAQLVIGSKFKLYSSTDGGITWTALKSPLYGGFGGAPNGLLVDPAAPQTLYMPVQTKLYKSTDAGQTWTSSTLPAQVLSIVGDPKDANHLWLGGAGGLLTSTDGGATFTTLATTPIASLALLPNGHLVAGGSRLYLSTDGGQTLQEAAAPDLALYPKAIVVSPVSPTTLYVALDQYRIAGLLQNGHGVLRSTDGGASWQFYSDGLEDRDVTSLALSADGKHLYAGTLAGGVFALDTP